MALIKRPEGATKRKKRLGRGPGTGNGTTAGKGTKGQNSRSGGGVRPGFEGGQMPLYRRVARRGFSNYRFKVVYVPVNLSTIEQRFSDGDTVDLESLRAHRIIGRHDRHVKVLANGELSKKLTVAGVKVSGSAQKKIESAGGSVASVPTGESGDAKRSTKKAKQAVESSAAEESKEE